MSGEDKTLRCGTTAKSVTSTSLPLRSRRSALIANWPISMPHAAEGCAMFVNFLNVPEEI